MTEDLEQLNWILSDWRMVIRSDKSLVPSLLFRNSEKVITWPRNKDLVEPIEKMKIWVWLAFTAFCQSGLQVFPQKKSVKVAYYKGNIFPGHLIPKKQPVEAEESIITRFNVQNGAWTRQGFVNNTAAKIKLVE